MLPVILALPDVRSQIAKDMKQQHWVMSYSNTTCVIIQSRDALYTLLYNKLTYLTEQALN